MTKVYYLAHNFLRRKLMRKWELKMEARYNIVLDSPFYDNPARKEEMKILDSMVDGSKEQRDFFAKRNTKNVVEEDLGKIRKSDGVIAFANDTRIGTPMEIFFASRVLRIPVYIVTKQHRFHPWILEHATKIFANRKELEMFIKKKHGLKGGLK